jgi:hypothetical protein
MGARERPVRVAEVAARPAACRVRSSGPSGTVRGVRVGNQLNTDASGAGVRDLDRLAVGTGVSQRRRHAVQRLAHLYHTNARSPSGPPAATSTMEPDRMFFPTQTSKPIAASSSLPAPDRSRCARRCSAVRRTRGVSIRRVRLQAPGQQNQRRLDGGYVRSRSGRCNSARPATEVWARFHARGLVCLSARSE